MALDGAIRDAMAWLNDRKDAAVNGEDLGLVSGDEAREIWRRVLVGIDLDFDEFEEFAEIAVVRVLARVKKGDNVGQAIKTVVQDVLIMGMRMGGDGG